MVFSSLIFICGFLPAVLAGYYLCPRKLRNALLLAASVVFYGWGEFHYLWVLFSVITLDYCGAILLGATDPLRASRRKWLLALLIAANLAALFWFKYCNFFMENIKLTFGFDPPFLEIILPLGISFYIFQSISYLVDVYRGDVEPQYHYGKLALFVSFFPQLVAGPILKYHDVARQIDRRREGLPLAAQGGRRFIAGLAKKVLIANPAGYVADQIFSTPGDSLSCSLAWLGAISYMLQIYFDFCGYSDMAIGLGNLFGFHFKENFNYPYLANSMTDFWRRWHISLSTWFKEYLYIPLGGNRVGPRRVYFNLFVVFLITGLWHGAEWSFILWGLYNGVFLILEKFFRIGAEEPAGFPKRLLRHGYLLVVVLFGWVLFRAPDIGSAGYYLKTMLGLSDPSQVYQTVFRYLTNEYMLLLAIACPVAAGLFRNVVKTHASPLKQIAADLFALLLLLLSLISLAGSTHNPFIYFRF